ncbi:synaptonemal complex central element protein 1 isoform X3 [Boleophthalmus pectinirostris]|uniref:synaptonemal complex central element protein 1 isoform X3 n=1 Tax=Boleophthalmus pectinirostris TaxID=150288 RepID=UPI002430D0D3|nr:synaptonemal complex central element protein 1 isoform X3 [Boleophthalmus pectinirostris]
MAGLNIAHVLISSAKGIGSAEPPVEQLLAKLKRLQQDKSALGEEIQEIQAIKESLQKEFETVQAESLQLEVIHKEKEELCQKLQYLCEESEQDFARQLKHNKSTEDLSEQYKCEIQAIKLKHRKLRMKFENHLYQLIEQKKNLCQTEFQLKLKMLRIQKVNCQMLKN